MDVDAALADLMEISSQVEAAAVLDESGEPLGSTLGDEERTAALARSARDALAAAQRVRGEAAPGLVQLDAATREGSFFVVREGSRSIAAVTAPAPTVGLVFYDLKTCLRALAPAEEAKQKPKRRRRKKAEAEDGTDAAA